MHVVPGEQPSAKCCLQRIRKAAGFARGLQNEFRQVPQRLKPHRLCSVYRRAEALRHPKENATRRFTANLHSEALPKNRFAELLPRIFTPSRHRETDPAAINPISWCLCWRSTRETEFHTMDISISVRYRRFGRVHNLRREFQPSDRAQRRPGQLIYCRTAKRCFRRFPSPSGH